MTTKEKSDTEAKITVSTDENDYKELFGNLRNTINMSKDGYKLSLSQTKDLIEQKKEELRLLEIRKHKLEGAIEASEHFLVAVLPNNNKKLEK